MVEGVFGSPCCERHTRTCPLCSTSSDVASPCLQVVAVMAVQIAMAYAVKDAPWWKVLVAAYVVSGTASQNLFTAQHELSHFLAFRKPLYNRILSLASNCPLVVPMATSFRKYHQEHHSHLVRCLLWGMVVNFSMTCLDICISPVAHNPADSLLQHAVRRVSQTTTGFSSVARFPSLTWQAL